LMNHLLGVLKRFSEGKSHIAELQLVNN
jgi:hypothetical protein